jgi:hypothetical protein
MIKSTLFIVGGYLSFIAYEFHAAIQAIADLMAR